MNADFFIAAVLIVLPLTALIMYLFSPSMRMSLWIPRAIEALRSRDYKTAEFYYQKLSNLQTKLGKPEDRAAAEFVAEHGLGICILRYDDFETSERHLIRAMELWESGVKCDRGPIAHLLAELAVAQRAQGKTGIADQTLHRLREVCEEADEPEIPELAHFVISSAHGASLRNDNDLAFQLAAIAQSVLERTDAWHAGTMGFHRLQVFNQEILCRYKQSERSFRKVGLPVR